MQTSSGTKGLFTERELEVVRLVRQGLSYREVAERLNVSPSTVRSHVSSVARLLPGDQSPLRKILRMNPPASPPTGE